MRLEICEPGRRRPRGTIFLYHTAPRPPTGSRNSFSTHIVALHKFCWPTSCPATHRAPMRMTFTGRQRSIPNAMVVNTARDSVAVQRGAAKRRCNAVRRLTGRTSLEDVAAYTEGLLKWWRTNGPGFKQWAVAARIVFAISPNSASCERVFSLLKLMYGDQQLRPQHPR